MTWRDRIQAASFRGVPFYVDTTARSGGRSIVVHEMPQRENETIEDTGRQPRRFSVEAYVLGDDYDLDLEKLIAACEDRPAAYPLDVTGLLVLPNVGRVRVACEGYRTVQESRVQRFAMIRLEFVRAGASSALTKDANPSGQLSAASSSAAAAAGEQAENALQLTGGPSVIDEAASGALVELGQLLRGLDVFSGPALEVAALSATISALIGQASNLATSPADLVVAVQQGIASILDAAGNAEAALYAYQAILSSSAAQVSSSTPSSSVELKAQQNANAIAQLVALSSLAGATAAAAGVTWPSLDDALEARAELIAAASAIELNASAGEFAALRAIRTAIVAAIPDPTASLPRIQIRRLSSPLPALLLAFRVTGATSRVADLIARNAVENPAFLPSNVDLEVLVDA